MTELDDELIAKIAKALSEQFTLEAIRRENAVAMGFGLVIARLVKVLESNGLPSGAVLQEMESLLQRLEQPETRDGVLISIAPRVTVTCLKSPRLLDVLNS